MQFLQKNEHFVQLKTMKSDYKAPNCLGIHTYVTNLICLSFHEY